MVRIGQTKNAAKRGVAAFFVANLMGAAMLATPAHADVQSGVVKYEAGDFSGAIQDWLPLASENDPNALFNLGQVYRLGRGVPKDMPTARNYYERAARLGHVSAQGNLGTLYFFAEDSALKDQEKAVSWWQEAATNGDARSQYMLGVLFFNGEVVDRDWTRAYAWMNLAASAGLPEASQAETSMLKHMTAAQVADAREISLTLVNPAGAFPNSMPIQFAKPSTPVKPASATPVSASMPVDAGTVVSLDASANKPAEAAAPAAEPEDNTPNEVAAGADVIPSAPEAPAQTAEPVQMASLEDAVPVADVASAPEAPAVTLQDEMPTSYSYKLQLAAFSTQDKASSAWDTFVSKHGDVLSALAPDVVAADLGERGTLYRLYANGFETKAEARDACGQLQAAGQGCLVFTVK